MTREQTLGMSFYPEQCGSAIECVTKKDALEAMSIYAQQTAIEFSIYLSKNYLHTSSGNWADKNNLKTISLTELYELYIQSKK